PSFLEAPRGLSHAAGRLVHYGFAASTTRVSLYLTPCSLVQFFAGPLGGLLGARLGPKWPLAIGSSFSALGAFALARWHASPAEVVIALTFVGLGYGICLAGVPRLLSDAVEPTQTGVTVGLMPVANASGGILGGQLVALLLTAYTFAGT